MLPTDQVAGVQRRRVGDVVVTALNDGFIVLPPETLRGVDAVERDAIYHRAGRRAPFASAINAYLVQWRHRTVLVDAGSGSWMGPDAGNVASNLEAAGVAPPDVDTVLMTHLHPDHAGGLLEDDGAARFPRAEVLVAAAEMAFWSDASNWAACPASTNASFDLAGRIAVAYGDRLQRFGGSPTIGALQAVALPGHTPGHTGYAIARDGEVLVLWGDICHAPEVQCARPDVTVVFDNDPAQAAATRRRMLERAVDEDLLVAGGHMTFPGFTRIARGGPGYVLQPDAWQYALSAA